MTKETIFDVLDAAEKTGIINKMQQEELEGFFMARIVSDKAIDNLAKGRIVTQDKRF